MGDAYTLNIFVVKPGLSVFFPCECFSTLIVLVKLVILWPTKKNAMRND